MKYFIKKCTCIVILFFGLLFSTYGIDSLKYSFSFNYYKDLSDTYDGGDLLSCEFMIHKSCFGLLISYGDFQSHSIFDYTVFIEEVNKTLSIKFDEFAIMKTASISGMIIPVNNKIVAAEIIVGLAFCKAQGSQFHDLDYSYSFIENRFNYLYKNYEYFKETHFGYQLGINTKFFVLPRFGIQLSARMQDLSNGGTFFFAGGGLCFKLNQY